MGKAVNGSVLYCKRCDVPEELEADEVDGENIDLPSRLRARACSLAEDSSVLAGPEEDSGVDGEAGYGGIEEGPGDPEADAASFSSRCCPSDALS